MEAPPPFMTTTTSSYRERNQGWQRGSDQPGSKSCSGQSEARSQKPPKSRLPPSPSNPESSASHLPLRGRLQPRLHYERRQSRGSWTWGLSTLIDTCHSPGCSSRLRGPALRASFVCSCCCFSISRSIHRLKEVAEFQKPFISLVPPGLARDGRLIPEKPGHAALHLYRTWLCGRRCSEGGRGCDSSSEGLGRDCFSPHSSPRSIRKT